MSWSGINLINHHHHQLDRILYSSGISKQFLHLHTTNSHHLPHPIPQPFILLTHQQKVLHCFLSIPTARADCIVNDIESFEIAV